MTPNEQLAAILAANPIIPVITISKVADAVPLARALVDGGITALEVTLRTPAAPDAIERIVKEVPEAIVGVGTIRSAGDVAQAVRLGAKFLVSPGTTGGIYRAVAQAKLPFLPGVATASELMAALDQGFDTVKFFPAVPAGGIAAIKALAGPFPQVRFCPTGGISEGNFLEWLAVPEIIAVGGSWLAPASAIKAGNWKEISAIARRARDAIDGATRA